jgi:hypothetical protein
MDGPMASHTATGEWQTYELRMRRRRVERLLQRAEAATKDGRAEEARACLEEAHHLAPELPATVPVPPTSAMSRNLWGAFTAIVTIAVVIWHRPTTMLPSQDLRGLAMSMPAAHVAAPPVVLVTEGRADAPAIKPAVADEPIRPDEPIYSEPLRAKTESARTESVRAAIARPSTPRPREDNLGDIAPVSEVVAVATAGVRLPATAPAPASSAPPRAPAPAPAASTDAVQQTLDRYAAAYSELDAAAAQRVWPTVNRGALARAFDALASQHVSLGTCRIDVAGAVARASCAGSATWAARIGDRSPRTEARQWSFDLARDGSAWRIVNARTQNR